MTYFVFKDAGYSFKYLVWAFDRFAWSKDGPGHNFESLDCAKMHAAEAGGDIMEVRNTPDGEEWRWL